jgi:hypothetical protein
MQRDGELDGAQTSREMTSALRDRIDEECAQLAREARELCGRKTAQVGGRADSLEQHKVSAAHVHVYTPLDCDGSLVVAGTEPDVTCT